MSKTILVIDDNAVIRDFLTDILARKGHTVLTAETGEDGLALCKGVAVDMVFTDIIMPDIDGIEVVMEIEQGYPDVTIIAMTGQSDLYLESAESLGAHHLLKKPFTKESVLEILSRAAVTRKAI